MPDHSSILNPTNTSGGAPGVAGTLDVTMGKEGEVLAQTLSFCLQGHSCLIGGSHCLVWHRCSECPTMPSCKRLDINFLVMAVSDNVLADVLNPAHSHTTEGAILCQ
ncbi:hypothetical protein PBY51_010716 [Eleginops maclovinus]|uniref:Uncharacterized protein n=1 Tax=Eleginops maclovinus TaxID=56733 RepID=A0AAN7XD66_ELEMC|nr:hypothetical protein PBY51_010716 [Eleginops maclovinus]